MHSLEKLLHTDDKNDKNRNKKIGDIFTDGALK